MSECKLHIHFLCIRTSSRFLRSGTASGKNDFDEMLVPEAWRRLHTRGISQLFGEGRASYRHGRVKSSSTKKDTSREIYVRLGIPGSRSCRLLSGRTINIALHTNRPRMNLHDRYRSSTRLISLSRASFVNQSACSPIK